MINPDYFQHALNLYTKERYKAEESWLAGLMGHYAPGITRLVNSGQRRIAMRYINALGFRVFIYPNGLKELRRHDVVLGRAKFEFTFKGGLNE